MKIVFRGTAPENYAFQKERFVRRYQSKEERRRLLNANFARRLPVPEPFYPALARAKREEVRK